MTTRSRLYVRYARDLDARAAAYRASFFDEDGRALARHRHRVPRHLGAVRSLRHSRGWTLPEVALLYGLVDVTFALADAFGRGFDTFGIAAQGRRLRPPAAAPALAVLQLLGLELQLMRIGRFTQGLIVLGWASTFARWTPATVALLAVSIIGTACLFLGIVVLQATSTFWTIETLEVWNAFTYGGIYAAQYPMSIYRRWFQRFFTFVIPLALASYYPARAILGRDELGPLQALGPLAGFAFLAATLGRVPPRAPSPCVDGFVRRRRSLSTTAHARMIERDEALRCPDRHLAPPVLFRARRLCGDRGGGRVRLVGRAGD